ncbi:hypothetical protein Bbelb_068220 [Branchiostoma belcheri]|nr:hypothetical protein Bbelb_068220 [Branchiostoma belcheri]
MRRTTHPSYTAGTKGRQPWKCESVPGPGPGARPVRIRPASGNLTDQLHKLPDDVCGFIREKDRRGDHGSASQYQGQARGLGRFGRPAECQSNGTRCDTEWRILGPACPRQLDSSGLNEPP